MKKSTFKKLIKNHIADAAFKELMNTKEKHSKLDSIQYTEFKTQTYLKSNSEFSNDEKYLLIKLRTRMCEMKSNYKNKYNNIQCELCKVSIDEQSHLFYCEKILQNCKNMAENVTIEYEDIFSLNIHKQVQATRLIKEAWEVREQLIVKSE